ncbi:uncharacterized protein MICPUCDRAFT_49830 [Micromonas pusilla CCMP1545]|uniref:Predicted protein n=1 Tax=Micromonas pusilla (strain CCMP1545) TaxID=564608 RepID=C1MGI9_MICPC|nr:uncharacterized protein MICPUCDRAFT_49830 [Micromonas pusilla CCMP1545]EEH60035.1 predicted protein [Micromonas pusilla CCMP1545]|eukprot:XP_003054783.1 predicted protein [Micromonas pusilla CCMP1545]
MTDARARRAVAAIWAATRAAAARARSSTSASSSSSSSSSSGSAGGRVGRRERRVADPTRQWRRGYDSRPPRIVRGTRLDPAPTTSAPSASSSSAPAASAPTARELREQAANEKLATSLGLDPKLVPWDPDAAIRALASEPAPRWALHKEWARVVPAALRTAPRSYPDHNLIVQTQRRVGDPVAAPADGKAGATRSNPSGAGVTNEKTEAQRDPRALEAYKWLNAALGDDGYASGHDVYVTCQVIAPPPRARSLAGGFLTRRSGKNVNGWNHLYNVRSQAKQQISITDEGEILLDHVAINALVCRETFVAAEENSTLYLTIAGSENNWEGHALHAELAKRINAIGEQLQIKEDKYEENPIAMLHPSRMSLTWAGLGWDGKELKLNKWRHPHSANVVYIMPPPSVSSVASASAAATTLLKHEEKVVEDIIEAMKFTRRTGVKLIVAGLELQGYHARRAVSRAAAAAADSTSNSNSNSNSNSSNSNSNSSTEAFPSPFALREDEVEGLSAIDVHWRLQREDVVEAAAEAARRRSAFAQHCRREQIQEYWLRDWTHEGKTLGDVNHAILEETMSLPDAKRWFEGFAKPYLDSNSKKITHADALDKSIDNTFFLPSWFSDRSREHGKNYVRRNAVPCMEATLKFLNEDGYDERDAMKDLAERRDATYGWPVACAEERLSHAEEGDRIGEEKYLAKVKEESSVAVDLHVRDPPELYLAFKQFRDNYQLIADRNRLGSKALINQLMLDTVEGKIERVETGDVPAGVTEFAPLFDGTIELMDRDMRALRHELTSETRRMWYQAALTDTDPIIRLSDSITQRCEASRETLRTLRIKYADAIEKLQKYNAETEVGITRGELSEEETGTMLEEATFSVGDSEAAFSASAWRARLKNLEKLRGELRALVGGAATELDDDESALDDFDDEFELNGAEEDGESVWRASAPSKPSKPSPRWVLEHGGRARPRISVETSAAGADKGEGEGEGASSSFVVDDENVSFDLAGYNDLLGKDDIGAPGPGPGFLFQGTLESFSVKPTEETRPSPGSRRPMTDEDLAVPREWERLNAASREALRRASRLRKQIAAAVDLIAATDKIDPSGIRQAIENAKARGAPRTTVKAAEDKLVELESEIAAFIRKRRSGDSLLPPPKRGWSGAGKSIWYNTKVELGRGSLGTAVYAGVYDEKAGSTSVVRRPAAIKRIPLPPGERGATMRALVEREVALHRHLNQNSNRVTFLFDVHLDAADAVFTAMERCGESLAQWLRNAPGGRVADLPVKERMDAAEALANAVADVHAAGVTHNDIKPDNCLRAATGEFKLADLGLGVRMKQADRGDDDNQYSMTTFAGYGVNVQMQGRPPEVLQGGALTSKVDVWSLGQLIYTTLTGSTSPYRDPKDKNTAGIEGLYENQRIINGKFDLVALQTAKLPRRVAAAARVIVSEMLQPDPTDRPTARDVADGPMFWSPERCVQAIRDVYDARIMQTQYPREVDEVELMTEALGGVKKNRKAGLAAGRRLLGWKQFIVPELLNKMKKRSRQEFYATGKVAKGFKTKGELAAEAKAEAKAEAAAIAKGRKARKNAGSDDDGGGDGTGFDDSVRDLIRFVRNLHEHPPFETERYAMIKALGAEGTHLSTLKVGLGITAEGGDQWTQARRVVEAYFTHVFPELPLLAHHALKRGKEKMKEKVARQARIKERAQDRFRG